MGANLAHLTGLEIFFLVSAAIGGGIFFVRLVIQLAGGVGDADAEIEPGHGDVEHADADASFKLLSLQGLTAFFMMFGLVGFALLRGSDVNDAIAVAGAVGAGLFTVWIIGRIFTLVKGLQSSGTVETASFLGAKGSVYLTIPPQGTGKVHLVLNGRLREYPAVSRDQAEIRTGVPIVVVQVSGNVVVVERS